MKKSKVGTKVGRWTILTDSWKVGTNYYVRCKCDCGTERDVTTSSLSGKNPRSQSCGCLARELVSGVKRQIPVGTVFGRLEVVGDTFRSGDDTLVPVRCSCGVEKAIRRYSLESGAVVSCGCYNVEKSKSAKSNLTHGLSKSNIYNSWASMKARCLNPRDANYHNYGGRGIIICDRWLESFQNFLEDMGERPEGLSLERLDVDGNYEPSNCVWASPTEQCFNRRKFKNTSSIYVGVNWDKWKQKWTATLKKKGKTLFKKDFLTEEAAARAYDEACFEHYGVRKNFPDQLNN